jgi:hypothetical protein
MSVSIDGLPEVDKIAATEIGSTVSMPGLVSPDSGGNQSSGTEIPIKRGRGRPPGSKNKSTLAKQNEESKLDLTEEVLKDFLVGLFDVLGMRQEHWRLSPAEAKSLTNVTYKFLVSISDKIGKFVGIGAVIGMWTVIILPRIAKSRQLQLQKREKVKEVKEVKETAMTEVKGENG